jgi:tetratricopeptide (TPR) repeat protein
MAEIRFEVLGRAKDALVEYRDIMADPGFPRLQPDVRARALADAAAAALATGDVAQALAHADAARAIAGGHPPANLVRARVLAARGEAEPAEVALRDADLTLLTPHARARFQVGAARVLASVGRHRAAVIEAEAATESDPDWPEAWLEAGRARLEVGNLGGAVEAVEAAAFRMRAREADRSARQQVVLPPQDWGAFRRALAAALDGDMRFAARGAAAPDLLGFAVGAGDALPRLARLVAATQDAPPAARVALAQAALERRAWADAAMHARAALATGRDLAFARAIQGVAAAEAGQAEEADSLLRQALQEAPQDPAIRRLHARARQRSGDRAGARAAWEEVLRLAPDDLGARRALVALDAG